MWKQYSDIYIVNKVAFCSTNTKLAKVGCCGVVVRAPASYSGHHGGRLSLATLSEVHAMYMTFRECASHVFSHNLLSL